MLRIGDCRDGCTLPAEPTLRAPAGRKPWPSHLNSHECAPRAAPQLRSSTSLRPPHEANRHLYSFFPNDVYSFFPNDTLTMTCGAHTASQPWRRHRCARDTSPETSTARHRAPHARSHAHTRSTRCSGSAHAKRIDPNRPNTRPQCLLSHSHWPGYSKQRTQARGHSDSNQSHACSGHPPRLVDA